MRKPFCRIVVLALIVMLLATAAQAARLGGGKTSGARPSTPVAPPAMQRSAPQPPPTSSFPQQPSPGQQAPAPLPQQQIPRQAPPAPQPSRFGGVGGFLGGMLAGGLIGSMLFGGGSHGMGMGGGGGGSSFGFLFDILLIGGLIWFLYRFVFRRKNQADEPIAATPAATSYTQPQGSPDPWDNLRTQQTSQQSTPPTAADYGFGQSPQATEAQPSAPALDLPPGFKVDEFIKGAKAVYVRLQSSWDRRDMKDLESFCAPAMLKDIKDQAASDPTPGRTDILMLEATLAAVNREGDNTVASVVFDAQLREDKQEGLKDVRELWHFIRDESKSGSNWVLYGIEQVQ